MFLTIHLKILWQHIEIDIEVDLERITKNPALHRSHISGIEVAHPDGPAGQPRSSPRGAFARAGRAAHVDYGRTPALPPNALPRPGDSRLLGVTFLPAVNRESYCIVMVNPAWLP